MYVCYNNYSGKAKEYSYNRILSYWHSDIINQFNDTTIKERWCLQKGMMISDMLDQFMVHIQLTLKKHGAYNIILMHDDPVCYLIERTQKSE